MSVAALFTAIRDGDKGQVASLLTADPSLVHQLDPQSFDAPPLNIAASRGHGDIVDLLLDHGADPNRKSNWWAGGYLPLDFADEQTSRQLISRGATLTAHAAARLGWADELARILAENPEVVHERGGDGQMPLHFAKTPEIADMLLDARADIEARDIDHEGTPAQHAIANEPVLRRLLQRGAQTDVFMAARLGDARRLAEFLDADPEALDRATGDAGNPQVPQAPGAHIYTYSLGFVKLDEVATRFAHEDVYQLLFDRGTPRQKLLMALRKGDGQAVHSLLAADSGLVETLEDEDRKALPQAAWVRNTAAVKLMLEIGFDPNIRGAESSTAIDRAAFHGFDDVIEAILPYGPDLTVVNHYGGTPLTCCLYGSVHGWRKDGDYARSVRLLIDAGAVLPQQPYGSPEVLAVLREYGLS